MNIEKFKYLWDGSQPNWSLQHIDHVVWYLVIHFEEMRPSNQEIINLRKIVPELKSKKISSIYQELKCHSFYRTQETYSNIESRKLSTQAIELGLTIELESKQVGGYLPISEDNSALIIEDDCIAKMVVERMIEAGVKVVNVHVD